MLYPLSYRREGLGYNEGNNSADCPRCCSRWLGNPVLAGRSPQREARRPVARLQEWVRPPERVPGRPIDGGAVQLHSRGSEGLASSWRCPGLEPALCERPTGATARLPLARAGALHN